MADLLSFLTERLNEDEAAAKECVRLGADVGDLSGWVEYTVAEDRAAEALFARFNPVRVLAEVEAKRRVLARHQCYDTEFQDDGVEFRCLADGDPWPCDDVRILGSVYQDRPLFREEWTP